jgi:hypothetical protein
MAGEKWLREKYGGIVKSLAIYHGRNDSEYSDLQKDVQSIQLPICVNLAGKVERRKSAGKGQVEITLTMAIPISVP